ncbi:MAG: hypothetical protein EU530_08480 [Promethearchaeota archaeon]|nr:MAG: hypothetical protein EU530_08480 [Candidatus Lokiarchaeota archaeon]
MGNVIFQINGEKYQIVNKNNILIKPEIIKKVEDFVEFSNFIREKSEVLDNEKKIEALSGAILEPYVLKITLDLKSHIIELA